MFFFSVFQWIVLVEEIFSIFHFTSVHFNVFSMYCSNRRLDSLFIYRGSLTPYQLIILLVLSDREVSVTKATQKMTLKYAYSFLLSTCIYPDMALAWTPREQVVISVSGGWD